VLSQGESGGGDIGGEDLSGGKFLRKSDRDAARARAYVDDGDIFASELGCTTGADFTDSKAVEGNFDEVFCLGARNEDVRGDFEIEAPEFLMTGEMLCGFAGDAALNEAKKFLGGGFRKDLFGVGVEPCAVMADYMQKQEFGCERVGWDVGFAKKMNTPLQQRAKVRGFGVGFGHES